MRNDTHTGAETMTTKRIAAGYYEVHTTKGTFEVVQTVPKNESGWPQEWAIKWPGEWFADEVAPTLREAKAFIAADVAATQEGA